MNTKKTERCKTSIDCSSFKEKNLENLIFFSETPEIQKMDFPLHVKLSQTWRGKSFSLETGKIAPKALSSVMVSYGSTRLLCTVTSQKLDYIPSFLPLSVHYQERFYAGGRLPGGFVKREGKPSEKEILMSRLIDRALRPRFEKHFYQETQVVCTLLSLDNETDLVYCAIVGACAALMTTDLPFYGPVAGGRFQSNTLESAGGCQLVLAATPEGMIMAECEALEMPEHELLSFIQKSWKDLSPTFQFLEEFSAKVQEKKGLTKSLGSCLEKRNALEHWKEEIAQAGKDQWHHFCALAPAQRREEIGAWKHHLLQNFSQTSQESYESLEPIFNEVWREQMRLYILRTKHRLDGRQSGEIRALDIEMGILPQSYGSALFSRGETQALASVTLGAKEEGQLVDDVHATVKENVLLHYNFPSFSVGEVGKMSGPSRRDIGHGRLALSAIKGVLPEHLPYTLRMVSEITSSCGSSSMATVCASALALIHAGIPLKNLVAGIAMGLILEKDNGILLSDISGLEDGIGDMDFKIAGSAKGITALQMDLKGPPLCFSILQMIFDQAKKGRLQILDSMEKFIQYWKEKAEDKEGPVFATSAIDPDRIRDFIGQGGSRIRQLSEATRSRIEVGSGGEISVFSPNIEKSKEALSRIELYRESWPVKLSGDPIPHQIYEGIVSGVTDFGVFVDFGFSKQGLVHISEIPIEHNPIHENISVGSKLRVRFLEKNAKGHFTLSIKQV